MSVQGANTWCLAHRRIPKMLTLLLAIIEQISPFLSARGNIKMDKRPLLPSGHNQEEALLAFCLAFKQPITNNTYVTKYVKAC